MNKLCNELREWAYASGWKDGVPSLCNPYKCRAKPFKHDCLHGFQKYVARSHTILIAYYMVLRIGLSIVRFAMRHCETIWYGCLEDPIGVRIIDISGDGFFQQDCFLSGEFLNQFLISSSCFSFYSLRSASGSFLTFLVEGTYEMESSFVSPVDFVLSSHSHWMLSMAKSSPILQRVSWPWFTVSDSCLLLLVLLFRLLIIFFLPAICSSTWSFCLFLWVPPWVGLPVPLE